MEKILDALFWIHDVFSQTRDPVLAQYRSLQRHWIVSAGSAILALVAEYFISASALVDNPYRPIIQAALEPFLWVGLGAMVISIAWMAWATYALWRFERDHN